VDLSGGFLGRRPALDRPGAAFVRPGGERRDQVEEEAAPFSAACQGSRS
jgi:hypothetical protein